MRPLGFLGVLSLMLGLLGGCAARGPAEDSGGPQGVGMHIDAHLEFAMEYPLHWSRERILYREEEQGVVHWTGPGNGSPRLSVLSAPGSAGEACLDRALAELPGFQTTLREQVKLPAGQAVHLMGYTARATFQLWFLSSPRRVFVIRFEAAPESFAGYSKVVEESVNSFIVLELDRVSPQPD